MPVADKSSKDFNIEGTSNDFLARSSNIFSGLTLNPETVSEFAVPQPILHRDLSPTNRSSMPERSQTERSRPEIHRSDRRQRARRSSERRITNNGGIARRRQHNSQQWTRHDLSDVDITGNNRQIAVDFRNSTTSRVNNAPTAPSPEKPSMDSVNSNLKFCRPATTVPQASTSVVKNQTGFGNLTMPEYEVGAAKQKKTNKPVNNEHNDQQIEKEAEREEEELYQAAKANIYLDHLLNDDDEEDEGNCE